MTISEEIRIQNLLNAIENARIIIKQMEVTCTKLEQALRGELNQDDELPPAA